MSDALRTASELIGDAGRLVVFSGAGVSAESGIPTYRSGKDALWSAADFERYANPRGYHAHLPESYRWYRERALGVARAEPNPAHHAVVALEQIVPHLLVVTQNVDGLHVRAGSRDVIELHGHLREARCDGCRARRPWRETGSDPACPGCAMPLRPDVVMFGEMLDEAELTRARSEAGRCDVLLSIGTSAQVWPAAEMPLIAQAAGAWVVIVNPDLEGQPTGERILHLAGRAGEVLPRLVPRRPT